MGLTVNLYIKKRTLFIRLKGEMDEHTSTELKLRLCSVIEKYQINNLVFNMQALEFMDSSGIGVILGRYNQIKMANGEIILCEMSEEIRRIVRLSGLERICKIKETEEKAKWHLELI